MKTYKVCVMKTTRYQQTVLVQAHKEIEAEEKVQYDELWNDDSWEFRDMHCDVLDAEETEEDEIVECILSEATHFWSNGVLHEIDGTVVKIWIENEKDFIENGKAFGIKTLHFWALNQLKFQSANPSKG
jgi:hypothetical protein